MHAQNNQSDGKNVMRSYAQTAAMCTSCSGQQAIRSSAGTTAAPAAAATANALLVTCLAILLNLGSLRMMAMVQMYVCAMQLHQAVNHVHLGCASSTACNMPGVQVVCQLRQRRVRGTQSRVDKAK